MESPNASVYEPAPSVTKSWGRLLGGVLVFITWVYTAHAAIVASQDPAVPPAVLNYLIISLAWASLLGVYNSNVFGGCCSSCCRSTPTDAIIAHFVNILTSIVFGGFGWALVTDVSTTGWKDIVPYYVVIVHAFMYTSILVSHVLVTFAAAYCRGVRDTVTTATTTTRNTPSDPDTIVLGVSSSPSAPLLGVNASTSINYM